ncbi:MAG TPA: phosphoribosylformylglycinamidine synthase [Bacteroidetes bacterium]|jgi:phosphoribosylformylglycinamidine synthase subunit PurS|nr:phosphoribosylformylglycinamidine synthase [Bacteroidota bacterium]
MFLSKVKITLRKSILDPQGKAVEHAVSALGVKSVHDVRMGKYIEFRVEGASEAEAKRATEEVCKKLLANPVMEDYHIEIEKV